MTTANQQLAVLANMALAEVTGVQDFYVSADDVLRFPHGHVREHMKASRLAALHLFGPDKETWCDKCWEAAGGKPVFHGVPRCITTGEALLGRSCHRWVE